MDANFLTGSSGLIAVDKVGNQILFLDPEDYTVTATLWGFAPNVHELLIAPDRRHAYVPIYGDGIHGNNPRPGHLIAVFDLQERRHVADFSVAPYFTPHTMRWGPAGQLYCTCEDSGVVLELNASSGRIEHIIEVGSNKAHRIEVTPDGSKLYTENEEDRSASVIDLKTRKRIKRIDTPRGLAGVGISPDGTQVILVDAEEPRILVVDTNTDEIVSTIELKGHRKGAQIARYSPDGKYLVVTSFEAPLATIFDSDLKSQRLLFVGQGPMNMAFKDDNRTLLIANQSDGSISVCDLEDAEVHRTIQAGVGVETLSFF